jgi:hypothetical protein
MFKVAIAVREELEAGAPAAGAPPAPKALKVA